MTTSSSHSPTSPARTPDPTGGKISDYRPTTGFWLTDSSVPAAEIVAGLCSDFVVPDVKHGMFDLHNLEYFIPLLKGPGLDVWAKVLGPAQAPIHRRAPAGYTTSPD